MDKYILPALIANASTLGIHWIYDHKFINKLSKKESLLFRIQQKNIYDQAETSYFSYPNQQLGDVTVQGDILKWLYQAIKSNPDFSQLDYSKLLYQQFKPGGAYHGYVESYAKKHVLTLLAQSLDIDMPSLPIMDDHLVGFMPYIVCKELNLDIKKAWELTQVYSQDEDYYVYFKMFDQLLGLIPKLGLKKAIISAIDHGPDKYQVQLHKGVEMSDPNLFIEHYSGRACAIKFSIPLIIHILYHTNSYEEAVNYNALLGGAISDRNMIIGMVMSQISKIPETWIDLVADKIKL